MSKIQAQQVFVCTDGSQHATEAAAEGAQFALDNAEIIETISESYVNTATAPGAKVAGLSGRTRAFNKNVAASVISFILAQGGTLPEDFEEILASDELQERLDADQAKADAAKAKADAAKAAKGEAVAEETADENEEASSEDLFSED